MIRGPGRIRTSDLQIVIDGTLDLRLQSARLILSGFSYPNLFITKELSRFVFQETKLLFSKEFTASFVDAYLKNYFFSWAEIL
jgi:hypothetical protein